MGLSGVWGCVITFQLVRLLQNWARLNAAGSPLNRRTPLVGVTAAE